MGALYLSGLPGNLEAIARFAALWSFPIGLGVDAMG